MLLREIEDFILEKDSVTAVRTAKFTCAEIENQIINLSYNGTGLPKDDSVENAKLPPFAQVFYYLFFSKLKIPDEKLFVNTYVGWLGGVTNRKVSWDRNYFNYEGIKNRLLRTYPSLIRDLHFYYLLNNSGKFEVVRYSLAVDYHDGLDIFIKKGSREAFISIFISTKRGNDFKKKKALRHNYSGVNEIELAVNFAELKRHGNFYLLSKNHIEKIYSDLIN